MSRPPPFTTSYSSPSLFPEFVDYVEQAPHRPRVTSISSLPPELIENILDELIDDNHALYQCARTRYCWVHPALSRLYRRIRVSSQKMARIITSSNVVSRYKTVELIIEKDSGCWLGQVWNLVAYSPGLLRLSLKGWTTMPSRLLLMPELSSLKELTLFCNFELPREPVPGFPLPQTPPPPIPFTLQRLTTNLRSSQIPLIRQIISLSTTSSTPLETVELSGVYGDEFVNVDELYELAPSLKHFTFPMMLVCRIMTSHISYFAFLHLLNLSTSLTRLTVQVHVQSNTNYIPEFLAGIFEAIKSPLESLNLIVPLFYVSSDTLDIIIGCMQPNNSLESLRELRFQPGAFGYLNSLPSWEILTKLMKEKKGEIVSESFVIPRYFVPQLA